MGDDERNQGHQRIPVGRANESQKLTAEKLIEIARDLSDQQTSNSSGTALQFSVMNSFGEVYVGRDLESVISDASVENVDRTHTLIDSSDLTENGEDHPSIDKVAVASPERYSSSSTELGTLWSFLLETDASFLKRVCEDDTKFHVPVPESVESFNNGSQRQDAFRTLSLSEVLDRKLILEFKDRSHSDAEYGFSPIPTLPDTRTPLKNSPKSSDVSKKNSFTTEYRRMRRAGDDYLNKLLRNFRKNWLGPSINTMGGSFVLGKFGPETVKSISKSLSSGNLPSVNQSDLITLGGTGLILKGATMVAEKFDLGIDTRFKIGSESLVTAGYLASACMDLSIRGPTVSNVSLILANSGPFARLTLGNIAEADQREILPDFFKLNSNQESLNLMFGGIGLAVAGVSMPSPVLASMGAMTAMDGAQHVDWEKLKTDILETKLMKSLGDKFNSVINTVRAVRSDLAEVNGETLTRKLSTFEQSYQDFKTDLKKMDSVKTLNQKLGSLRSETRELSTACSKHKRLLKSNLQNRLDRALKRFNNAVGDLHQSLSAFYRNLESNLNTMREGLESGTASELIDQFEENFFPKLKADPDITPVTAASTSSLVRDFEVSETDLPQEPVSSQEQTFRLAVMDSSGSFHDLQGSIQRDRYSIVTDRGWSESSSDINSLLKSADISPSNVDRYFLMVDESGESSGSESELTSVTRQIQSGDSSEENYGFPKRDIKPSELLNCESGKIDDILSSAREVSLSPDKLKLNQASELTESEEDDEETGNESPANTNLEF